MSKEIVPTDFAVPDSFEGPGFQLAPLGPVHNERDHDAWMSSIDHIRATPGFDSPDSPWPVPMSLEANLKDLERHAQDFAARTGFTYSILDADEVIGCLYIYAAHLPDHDVEVQSWVRTGKTEMDGVVRAAVSEWIHSEWPFANPLYAARP